MAPGKCGSGLCCCPCFFSSFQVKEQNEGIPLAEMHMNWPENPGLFGFNFPPSLPKHEKVFFLMAAVLMVTVFKLTY